MKIIIDSNILFSALIKNSLTRRMVLDYNGYFLFPSFIFEEMEKHKGELLKKSKMNAKDFNLLLNLLLRKVMVVPIEALFQYRKKAYEIIKDVDPDDTIFIACALAHPDSVIWSDDKKLKQQTHVRVINTTEMHKVFYGGR
ncbi:MAG: PIN domain-containing protein [Candidatus Thermoplasmatota archaeon]|nr:PIN domain-containing protein [Candidatus Thermoplasmatota archaeon]